MIAIAENELRTTFVMMLVVLCIVFCASKTMRDTRLDDECASKYGAGSATSRSNISPRSAASTRLPMYAIAYELRNVNTPRTTNSPMMAAG